MDPKAQKVEAAVENLYIQKIPERDIWADWLWKNHVLWVANKAEEIAKIKGFDQDLCRVAGLLHDLADSVMARANPDHEEYSLGMARQIMQDAGYDAETTVRIIDDALRKHSCHGDERPESNEGKALATADGLAHLQSDFYPRAMWIRGTEQVAFDEAREWVRNKIDRDFNNKLLFDDIKEQARPNYETLKMLFSA